MIKALQGIGFPTSNDVTDKQRREAVLDFQRGFTFGRPLVQDGFAGSKTEEALRFCLRKDGRCSENFRFAEFESKGNQDFTIKVSAALVLGLEELRMEVGPITVLSGYRDPAHNEDEGGKPNSQHLFGNAMDPVTMFPLAAVLRVKRFSGIGTDASPSGPVRHIDVRHVGPNTTGSSVERPARFVE
ncbi:MAG TPA: D-Ala-D-Ala carboxypeptidase family metallohydrolase [Actinomycetota bacterium]|nr:D-Ala-D-Ala carboxypeptidase family metallohydrolase [Actinomycetota bacterium]